MVWKRLMTLGLMSQSKRRSGCDGIGGLLMPLATFVVSSAVAEVAFHSMDYRAILPSRASLAFKDSVQSCTVVTLG